MIIPDSAHGTNPASVAIAGYEPVVLASDGTAWWISKPSGMVDQDVAAMMVTNPNTLGLFEKNLQPGRRNPARQRRFSTWTART